MKRIVLLIIFLFLASCATNVIPVTKDKLTPYQGTVSVYRSESEVPAGYKVIATLTHYDWGKYRSLSIYDAIPILQEKAQEQGANAIIIDNCKTVYSGIFSRGIDVTARAIIISKASNKEKEPPAIVKEPIAIPPL